MAIITVLMIGFGIMSVPVSYLLFSDSTPPSCNMKIATNRGFNKYYGIIDMPNHFTLSQTEECRTNIIYQPALPQMILNSDHSATSFMTLAGYGT
ncbi:unnamed protein product, partial [Adineta steineri]